MNKRPCFQLQHLRECMASETRQNFTDQVVTPELAAIWVEQYNTRNRSLKPSQILRYANDMKAGRWTVGSRIIFYKDGILCDGQNRLAAVALANQPLMFDVMVGATQEEGANIDTGSKRSTTDALKISGAVDWVSNNKCVAMINWIAKNGPSNIRSTSHYDVVAFALANEQWLRPIAHLYATSTTRKQLSTAAFYAQLAVAHRHGEPLDELLDFNHRFITGENYERSKNAVIKLRELCLTEPSCWSSSQTIETAMRTQRCIKAFVEGQHLEKLYAPSKWIYEIPTF